MTTLKASSVRFLPRNRWLGLVSLAILLPSAAAFLPPSHPISPAKRSTAQFMNVASTFIKPEEDEGNSLNSKSSRRLSRPERKALERARKQRKNTNHRKHNFEARDQKMSNGVNGGNGMSLNSKRVSALTKDSTADDVMKAIKRAQNLHDKHDLNVIAKFLLEEVDESFAYGYLGSMLARFAVAALHMNDSELARRAIEYRRSEYRSSMLPMESAAIIRGLLRVHNVTDAMKILDDELALPLEGTPLDEASNKDRIKHRALSLGSIASRHFFEGEPSMAVHACRKLADLGPIIRTAGLTKGDLGMPWGRLVRGAAACESGRRDGSVKPCEGVDTELPCNLVYSVLDAKSTFPGDNSDRVYESISNALVRRILFVTGAVNMAGCPPSDRGEAAFIGRSNVGKSSLVNMVTNRKSLAYTSKTPGKTQQFNYFTVNDIPGREKEFRFGDEVIGEKDPDSFYIVDLPGFGFARVSQKQKDQWSAFMEEYVTTRKNLRVLFHLVDGRHGPIDEDSRIMKLMGENLPKNVKYVVVLTKADKNVKGPSKKNTGKVSREVMQNLREIMNSCKVGNAPVILTSAETKLGRDSMWRYLSLAAEG